MMNKIKQWFQLPPKTISENNTDHALKNRLSSSRTTIPSQVKDADLEFLFHQLLEGVVNGWQQNRISQFLEKLEGKISLDVWLNWLQRYREQLISSPAPNTQLAARMIMLGEITASLPFVRAIGDSAYEIGEQLLNRAENHIISESTPEYTTITQTSVIEDEDSSSWGEEILSLLPDTPHSTVDTAQNLELDSIDPSVIMAEIAEQTQSQTKPTFSDSAYSLSAEDIFNIGLEKAQAGDLERALSLWQEAVALEPNFAPAWHNLGSAYAYLNRLSEAIQSFDQALAINVNDYVSWSDRGNALFRLQRWQEAIISWDRVIGIQPDCHQVWYRRGLALEKLELYAEALASYEKCLTIDPDFKPAQKRQQNLQAQLSS